MYFRDLVPSRIVHLPPWLAVPVKKCTPPKVLEFESLFSQCLRVGFTKGKGNYKELASQGLGNALRENMSTYVGLSK